MTKRPPKAKAGRASTTPGATGGRGWLRIIGGIWRGRKIPVTAAEGLRPTNERAREAIFNRLMHAQDTFGVNLIGARIADVFAGSGALGLEALSRGAASAVFVERDRSVCKDIEAALQTLGADDRADVVNVDATALPPAARPCNIILMDPPYAEQIIGATLTTLQNRNWLKPGALVVIETEKDADLQAPAGFSIIDQRTYGRALISFLKAA